MIDDITEKIYAGQRISVSDAQRLYQYPNIAELGMLAHWVRKRLNPDPVVTYNIGRNNNFTNI